MRTRRWLRACWLACALLLLAVSGCVGGPHPLPPDRGAAAGPAVPGAAADAGALTTGVNTGSAGGSPVTSGADAGGDQMTPRHSSDAGAPPTSKDDAGCEGPSGDPNPLGHAARLRCACDDAGELRD